MADDQDNIRSQLEVQEMDIHALAESTVAALTEHRDNIEKGISVLLLIVEDAKLRVREIEDKLRKKEDIIIATNQEAAKLRELKAFDVTLSQDIERCRRQQIELKTSLTENKDRLLDKEASIRDLRLAEDEDNLHDLAMTFSLDRRHHRFTLRQFVRQWRYYAVRMQYYGRKSYLTREHSQYRSKTFHWRAWVALYEHRLQIHSLERARQLKLIRQYWHIWQYQLMFEECSRDRYRHRLLNRCYHAWVEYKENVRWTRTQENRILKFQHRWILLRCVRAWRSAICFVGSMVHPSDKVARLHRQRSVFSVWRHITQNMSIRSQLQANYITKNRAKGYFRQWKCASFALWHRRRHMLRLFYRRLRQNINRANLHRLIVYRGNNHSRQLKKSQAIMKLITYHSSRRKPTFTTEWFHKNALRNFLKRFQRILSKRIDRRMRMRSVLKRHLFARQQLYLHNWLRIHLRGCHTRKRARIVRALIYRRKRLRKVLRIWHHRFYSALRQRYQLMKIDVNYQKQIRALHDNQIDEILRCITSEDQRLTSVDESKRSLESTLQSKSEYVQHLNRSCHQTLEEITDTTQLIATIKTDIDALRDEETEFVLLKEKIEISRRVRAEREEADRLLVANAEEDVHQLEKQVKDFQQRIAALEVELSTDVQTNENLLQMSEETMNRMNALLQAQAATIAQLSAEDQNHARQMLEIMLRADEMKTTAAEMIREKDQEIRHKTATVNVLSSEIGKDTI